MRLDLYAPALIVAQMNVQFVYFVIRKNIYIMFYFIKVHPCTCHVKHESTVLELWAVLNLATLNGYRQFSFFSVYFTRHKLEKTLYTVEYTAVAASPYLNACAFDCEDILLRLHCTVGG